MMTTHDHDRDHDQYDADAYEQGIARAPMTARAKILVVAGLVALIAVTSYFGWWFASVPVRWQEVGFSVTSPEEIVITFDVYLYTDQLVTCELEALNTQYAQVGVTYVTVDPTAGSQQRFIASIATVEEATTAVVSDCRP